MSGGNGTSLTLSDLRQFRLELAEATGKDKLDLLLSAADPLATVRALPEAELYMALLEIGPEDAADIVSLSSAEQFAHFVDRSTWLKSDEGPDTKGVLHWLTLARESARSDQALERYREKLAKLDIELLELLLREQTRVYSLEETPDPPIEDWGRTWHTAERKYVVEFVAEGGDYGTLKQLLDDLVAQDPFITTRLLEAIRWEVPSELAETARRWRDGRLRDLGFPQLDEAIAFYARPAKRAPAVTPANPAVTGLARPASTLPLLDRALALVPSESFERAEESVLYAANAALVANNVAPDDALAARTTLQETRSLLSLGLDVLAGGDAGRAAALLAERPIKQIFQAGMGELYALQTRARLISQAGRLPGAKSATLLESPWSDLMAALERKRPTLLDPRGKGRTRTPSDRSEVAIAEAALDEAAAALQILELLGAGPAVVGPAAEAAGLLPSAVRARDALTARARAALAGKGGVSFLDPGSESDTGQTAESLAAKVAELVTEAAAKIGTQAAVRAAAVLAKPRPART